MPITLNPDLYAGNTVPLRYDLLCDHTEVAPSLYFTCHAGMLVEKRITTLVEMCRQSFPALGEFLIGDSLGFDGILRGTLCILESVLEFENAPANSADIEQLFVIRAMCDQGQHGASMTVTLSPSFRRWIESNREVAESTARVAMVSVAERMWPSYFSGETFSREMSEFGFRVWHHADGRGLLLEVPGDATSIGVDGSSLNDGPGWHLTCHNLDSAAQQLELRAGLCTMARIYREQERAH